MMKNLLITLILLTNFSPIIAQEIEILKQSDSIPNIKEKGLVFINEKTDLTDYHFIAKVKITSDDFNQILIGLQKTAIDLSANAFKYLKKENLENKTSVLIDLYSANPELIECNEKNNQTNLIYFFGNDSKTQKFKIDNQKIELKPNAMYRFQIPKNKKVKVNKGGFAGMTVFHHWKENQPVIFYAFGSGNLSGYADRNNTIGLSISTGTIIQFKSDFAYLLMELKK